MGNEKNPMQALAIYLSEAKHRFRPLGGGFWELALPEHAEASIGEPMEAP